MTSAQEAFDLHTKHKKLQSAGVWGVVDIDGIPLFYVNASGRSGLSGAPVVLRLSGGYGTSDGKFILGGGYQTKFMGIYSGRICEDSDVGRVWKPIVLNQIIETLKTP